MVTLWRPHCTLIRTPSNGVRFEHAQSERPLVIPLCLLAIILCTPQLSTFFSDAVGLQWERCFGVNMVNNPVGLRWTFADNKNALLSLSICFKFQPWSFLEHIALIQGKKWLANKCLMTSESSYHFDHLLQVFNKALISDFNIFPHAKSPREGQITPLIQNTDFYGKQCPFFASSFKRKTVKILFHAFFFIHVYSPSAGARKPLRIRIHYTRYYKCYKFPPLIDFATSFLHIKALETKFDLATFYDRSKSHYYQT